jgi:hypothetical protein
MNNAIKSLVDQIMISLQPLADWFVVKGFPQELLVAFPIGAGLLIWVLLMVILFRLMGLKTTRANTSNDQSVPTLLDIEQDMLALKNLHDAGKISTDIYVDETRKLYRQAQTLS